MRARDGYEIKASKVDKAGAVSLDRKPRKPQPYGSQAMLDFLLRVSTTREKERSIDS